jgi:hypothetical protein
MRSDSFEEVEEANDFSGLFIEWELNTFTALIDAIRSESHLPIFYLTTFDFHNASCFLLSSFN